MELRDYLKIGATKAGSLTALGRELGLMQQAIDAAKAHKRALPLDAVFKLSDYIGADLKAVIAANELVTEKKEEKRNFWAPFVETARAAVAVLTIATVVNLSTATPAQAAPTLESKVRTVCIMSTIAAITAAIEVARNTLCNAVPRVCS